MASYATASPESVITVKINYDGCTRRAKMVLRDMVPGQLEQQVRTFLRIPTEQELAIERYSDSAGTYVVLDSTNVAVYKQLYRAAKAKSKLKLRVTNPNSKPAPRPVTVEEVADISSSAQIPSELKVKTDGRESEESSSSSAMAAPQQPLVTPRNTVEVTLPFRSGSMSKTYDSDKLSKAAQHLEEFENLRKDLHQRLHMFSNEMSEVHQPALTIASEAAARRLRIIQDMHKSRVNNVKGDLVNLNNSSATQLSSQAPPARSAQGFAVCCNSCDKTMPDVHYHCSTCDDGDFDLCSSCVDLGITCHSPQHWMIKRTTVDGQIVNSTTEVIPPKPKKDLKPKVEEKLKAAEPAKPATCYPPPIPLCFDNITGSNMFTNFDPCSTTLRTCNNCIDAFGEKECLHCTVCDDFDLCKDCFAKNKHGHHPMHAFAPAVPGTEMPENIKVKLAPGRNQLHHAICDGCDKYIMGVRHKCLDCPDWDFCASCQPTAHILHPGHRFVPIFTPLVDSVRISDKSVHQGICCDGPLCAKQGYPAYIRGTRYKCAVCDDVDFCANCEANPGLGHNKTHPLIKIKTPIRHINVTTTGEKGDGSPMRVMGDGARVRQSSIYSASPTSQPEAAPKVAPAPVAELKIESPKAIEAPKTIETPEPVTQLETLAEPLVSVTPKPQVAKQEPKEFDLNATFVRDTVVDGTIMPENHVFEQSWVLRNEGPVAWPAGCSVKYVGGDYMGHVDSNHPAEISKLVSASESIVCYEALAPGQEFAFTVLLRTPSRPGKFVSYWRLSTPEGMKFGHRLWCDVVVRAVKVEEPKPVVVQAVVEEPVVEEAESSAASSTMIFPKLEKESPSASMHEHSRGPSTVAPSTIADDKVSSTGVPDESAEDEDWDVSEDGFLTDEEYDILDASDEELLEEHAKKMQK